MPAPVFDQSVYTVPEEDPGSVPLCVDIGVVITEPLTYTISTAQKSPPQAEGMANIVCLMLEIFSFPYNRH